MALPLSGYVRVSKVGARGGEGFISPDVQERAIRDWSERTGAEVVLEPHELNVSGGTMERPVFGEIMEKIRTGKSEGIVVYKLDRFARSLLGAVTTMAELGAHDAVLASATEPELDYTTPTGKAFMQQMFVFAEFVRSTLKESWATAQRHAIERGVHISPNGYLGYDLGEDRRLVPNPQAVIVREVFQRRGAGETWGTLADHLNAAAPKPDGTLWTAQAVQRLCAKRIYRGEASRYVGQDVDGRGPIINRDAHPALVTEAEWQAAQVAPRIEQREGKPLPLLSGLIRCAGCRYALSLGRGPKGETLYRCRARHASGRCPEPAAVKTVTIEAYVEGLVLGEIEGVAKMVPDSGDREGVLAELARARDEYDELRRSPEAKRQLGADWLDTLDAHRAPIRELEADLERIDQRIGVVREGLTRAHYLDLPVSDRREVLSGFIDCVFVRRSRGRGRNVDPIESRTRVLWRGEAPADLPRRRVVNEIRSFDLEGDVEARVVAPQDGA
jgi:DNA invertase Pin-like site-specific DNA recombinase